MVTTARRCALFATLALTSCYDMEQLDPGPAHPRLLIDDFEDGVDPDDGGLPEARQFERWSTEPFNADNNLQGYVQRLDMAPGYASDYAIVAEFRFIDPGNPQNEKYTGANLGVSDARPLLDARFFEAIHFAIRFDSGTTRFPLGTNFYVQLGCDSAPTIDDVNASLWVNAGIGGVTDVWQTGRARMESFHEPPEAEHDIKGSVGACLARVDSIRFTVSTNMRAQQPLIGKLYLDDIEFK